MLHNDGASNIYHDDCFIKLPDLKNMYDRFLMNPPFSQSDLEMKFVYYTLLNMKQGGILGAIIPKICLIGSERNKNDIDYLEKILNLADIKYIVTLPNQLFEPNAS